MNRILVVVSEKGYTWDEVVLPVQSFKRAGYQIAFATPTGNKPSPDPQGIKCFPFLHVIGYGTHSSRNQHSPIGQDLTERLNSPMSLKDTRAQDFCAIYIAGGHGALFDLHGNNELNNLIGNFYQQGKVIGALCHSSSILCGITIGEKSLASRHRLTGFPTLMEHLILSAGMVDKSFRPMPVWTGKVLNQDTSKRPIWFRILEVINHFTSVADGQVVTGVGPKSSKAVARKMLSVISQNSISL